MGNEINNKQRVKSDGKSVFLVLRSRDIILHYSYKMKLTITDISLFPHGLEGLKLWDTDIVLSRYIVLQNERFGNKTALVLKGGVGIVGITLSKWAGCKKVDMCDTNKQVVGNMNNNCQRNGTKGITCFEVNIDDYTKYKYKHDFAFVTDILNEGVKAHIILNIWRKVLKIGGEAIMVMPENKQRAKRFLDNVDRQEFTISNVLLTAEEYDSSPLLNKLQGQAEFPLLGNTPFYAITLKKLKQMPLESQKDINQKIDLYKTPQKQSKLSKQQQANPPSLKIDDEKKSLKILQSQKQISIPITMTKSKIEQERDQSPIKKIQKGIGNQGKQLSLSSKLAQTEKNPQPGSGGL